MDMKKEGGSHDDGLLSLDHDVLAILAFILGFFLFGVSEGAWAHGGNGWLVYIFGLPLAARLIIILRIRISSWIAALAVTAVALLYLPRSESNGQFSRYDWFADLKDVHGITLAIELFAIWVCYIAHIRRDPKIAAVAVTAVALLYLPGAQSDGQFSHYYWIADLRDLHWLILAVELIAIWGGFFLYEHYFKPVENE